MKSPNHYHDLVRVWMAVRLVSVAYLLGSFIILIYLIAAREVDAAITIVLTATTATITALVATTRIDTHRRSAESSEYRLSQHLRAQVDRLRFQKETD